MTIGEVIRRVVLAAVALAVVWTFLPRAATVPPVRVLTVAPGVAAEVHRPVEVLDAPTVVLLHGCCGDPADLGALARELRRRGALVVNASWTTRADGAGWPRSYRHATCAVASARALAGRVGARMDRLVVVGWSDGALLATVAGLRPPEPSPGCRTHTSGRPDAVVAIGGFFGWMNRDRDGLPLAGRGSVRWFGGTPASAPGPWEGGNPDSLVRGGVTSAPPFDLVVGARDPLSAHGRRFARRLDQADLEVRLHRTDRGAAAMVNPRTSDGAVVVELVLSRAAGP